jgi:DNA-directed RNA polymerase specialized sigma24 family protein
METPPKPFEELTSLATAADPTDRARALGQALDAMPDLQAWISHARRDAVLGMREEGQSYADIAKNLGFSRSRAQQIVEGRVTGRRAKAKVEQTPSPAEPDAP